MSLYQHGTSLWFHHFNQAIPGKTSLRTMKANSHLQTTSLLARVKLVKLTPSKLPFHALHQYYKLTRNHACVDFSGSNASSTLKEWCPKLQNNVVQGIESTAQGNLHHKKTVVVDHPSSSKNEKFPSQEALKPLPCNCSNCIRNLNGNSYPVNGFSIPNLNNIAKQAIHNNICVEISKDMVEKAFSLSDTASVCLDKNANNVTQATNSAKIIQGTGPSNSRHQSTIFSATRESLEPFESIIGNASSFASAKHLNSFNTAANPSSTSQQLNPWHQYLSSQATENKSSLNVRVAHLTTNTIVTSLMKHAVPLRTNLVNNATNTLKNKQSLHLKHCLRDTKKIKKILAQKGRLPHGARVCQVEARVCLSPLKPNQLPANAHKQYLEILLQKCRSSCSFKSENAKGEQNLNKVSNKKRIPLQARKDNFQSIGLQKGNEYFVNHGQLIPSFTESLAARDEWEYQPYEFHINNKSNSASSKNNNNSVLHIYTKGTKRKADKVNKPRRKFQKLDGMNCEKKPKTRNFVIPSHYRNIELSQISSISHIKMRYRVAFARWPEVFGGALDTINNSLASQNAIWKSL